MARKGPGRTAPQTERPRKQPPPAPCLAPAGSAMARGGAPGALCSTPPNCPRPPVPGAAGWRGPQGGPCEPLSGPGAQDCCGEGSLGGGTQMAPPKPQASRLTSKEQRGLPQAAPGALGGHRHRRMFPRPLLAELRLHPPLRLRFDAPSATCYKSTKERFLNFRDCLSTAAAPPLPCPLREVLKHHSEKGPGPTDRTGPGLTRWAGGNTCAQQRGPPICSAATTAASPPGAPACPHPEAPFPWAQLHLSPRQVSPSVSALSPPLPGHRLQQREDLAGCRCRLSAGLLDVAAHTLVCHAIEEPAVVRGDSW